MSGSDLHLYADERDVLRGMPHAVRLMYEAIRVRMDGATCVSGRRTRLSYRALMEEIEVPAERGRRNSAEVKPSGRQVEYGIELLMRAGLIARAGAEPMVFLLPVALRASSVRRNNGRSAGHISGGISGAVVASADAGCSGISGGISGGCEDAISGVHQRSDNSCSVGAPEGAPECTRVAPTVAGALCARLRVLGVSRLSTAHPRLLEALGKGIGAEAFEAAVSERVQRGHDPPTLAWLAEAVLGKHGDRAKQEHAYGVAASGGGNGRSSSERAEAACRHGDELARRRVASGLRAGPGDRAPASGAERTLGADGWDIPPPLDFGDGAKPRGL